MPFIRPQSAAPSQTSRGLRVGASATEGQARDVCVGCRSPSRIAHAGANLIPTDASERDDTGVVARLALALTAWTERWIPDAFVFALVATVVVVVAALDGDAVDRRRRSSTPGAAASGS